MSATQFSRYDNACPVQAQCRRCGSCMAAPGAKECCRHVCRFMLADDHEEIMLKSRRGIAAVAVETNTPVVPVYHLGNSRLLKFGPQWLMGASRKLRTSLGLVFGRWCLPLPFKRPLHMLSGKALHPGMRTCHARSFAQHQMHCVVPRQCVSRWASRMDRPCSTRAATHTIVDTLQLCHCRVGTLPSLELRMCRQADSKPWG